MEVKSRLLGRAEFADGARSKPGMYLGGSGSWAFEQIVNELVANSIDQFLQGEATQVKLSVEGNQVVIEDDGPGLPYDQPSTKGYHSLVTERFFGHHDTPSIDGHAPHIHLGNHGVGLSCTQVFCTRVLISSWRNGVQWEQSLANGDIYAERKLKTGEGRGTRIELEIDPLPIRDGKPRLGVIRKRLFDAVHLFPGLLIEFNGERFHSANGLLDLAHFYLQERGDNDRGFLSPYPVSLHERVGDFEINVALVGSGGRREYFGSWVNGTKTPDHGSHVNGIRTALKITGSTTQIALIHVLMHDARFAGPTKARLMFPQIAKAVRALLTPELVKRQAELRQRQKKHETEVATRIRAFNEEQIRKAADEPDGE